MATFDRDLSLTWLGHNAFHLVTPGGKHVLVDPWLEGNPMAPVGGPAIERVDVMLLTHGHGDHTGDAVRLAARFKPSVVCNYEMHLYLQRKGVTTTAPMNKGGTQSLAGLGITMVHATHSSSFDDGGQIVYAGEAAGFVVALENGTRVYFAGDTGLTTDMTLVGELYRPDIAVIPIGDLYTMGPREAAHAAKFVRAKWIIPSHYGTFPALTGTPEALIAELEALGVKAKVVAPKPGEVQR
jgi:L-ascorbate metabolism protein UlaG (beta-lactamase superfamily)